MANVVKANGYTKSVSPKNGSDFSLEELKKVVGGYIEVIYMPDNMVMVVDEEGKLKGKPINNVATIIYHAAYPDRNDVIVGDVLFCRNKEIK